MSRTLYLITPHAKGFPADLQADYIGIDAGACRIEEAGLPLLQALGDFDSLNQNEKIPDQSLIYPVRKDCPDSELAMQLAMKLDSERHYDQIILWGGISGRLDHTYANLRLISYSYPRIVLQDEKQKAWILEKGRHSMKPDQNHISFFSIGSSCISLDNFLYDLDHHELDDSSVLTLSNHFRNSEPGIVTVYSGRLLAISSSFK